MKESENYLGFCLDMRAPKYYVNVVEEALNKKINCFMFYTSSPESSQNRLPTDFFRIDEARKILVKNNFNEDKIVIHAPFTINLANSINLRVRKLTLILLSDEIKRVNDFHVKILVVHTGNGLGCNINICIKTIIDNLNFILDNDNTDVKIALETMSGKGSELGCSFEQIKTIIDGIHKKNRIGVCLDICHIHDAGYDVSNVDNIINQFNQIVGLDKLLAIHISDSLNERGTRKDRHTHIGKGFIGLKVLREYVQHPKLFDIPKILETPFIEGIHEKEIEMLKN